MQIVSYYKNRLQNSAAVSLSRFIVAFYPALKFNARSRLTQNCLDVFLVCICKRFITGTLNTLTEARDINKQFSQRSQ